jgi:murein L,D-transpeptidase YcbB/YkuD
MSQALISDNVPGCRSAISIICIGVRLLRSLIPALLLAVVLGGSSALAQAPAVDSTPAPLSGPALAVQQALAHPSEPLSRYHLDLAALRRFYEGRNFVPAWHGTGEAGNAAVALAALEGAASEGLDPSAYRTASIRLREGLGSPGAFAEADLLVTAGVLGYMRHLRSGRVAPAQVERDISFSPVAIDPVSMLAAALAAGTLQQTLAALHPPHPEYENLKRALARYSSLEEKGGWPQTFAMPKADDAIGIANLTSRLAIEDDGIAGAVESPEALADAIKRFQARNGLEETGVAGKETLAALNVPVAQRVDQITANMERWRWLPPYPQRYIEVNTADATLKIVDGGKVVIASRIIAGKRATPTPMFATQAVAITVNPYWNIPAKIARNEILPKERRRPGYMAGQHIFTAGDGSLKQRPGADNALGYIKLEMPNRFDVYLHDTPARRLFARTDRHFSHGCMRVQLIKPLASWALSGDSAAATEKLEALIETGVNQRIPLDTPRPVFVLYWTAIADRDGSVGFRPDVYGRDGHLLAALSGQRPVGRLSLNTECQASRAG